MSRLTILDIARLSGVSRTTASRVLNGRGEVRAEVRARVEQVIAENNYRPLASARSLSSQRTGVIGLVIPLSTTTIFGDPFFGVLGQAVSRAAARRGLTAALFLLDEESDQEALVEHVAGPRRVDGIIASAYHVQDTVIAQLADVDTPVVVFGATPRPDRVSSVLIDNHEGGRLAGNHLARRGHRRIAMIGGPQDTVAGRERSKGFLDGLRGADVDPDPVLLRTGDFTRRSGEVLMRDLLPERPDAVFVASDTMAVGALAALGAAGLSAPRDVAVLGFDDLPGSAEIGLSTVRQPVAEVGEAAVEILFDMIEHGRAASVRHLPLELVLRGSA